MRYKNLITTITILLVSSMITSAQTYEKWSGNIGSRTYNGGGTTIAELEGDVTLTGTITVDNYTTLRIINKIDGPGREITISNGVDSWRDTPMFKVIGGSKLAFNYVDYPIADNEDELDKKYNQIIIDGGAAFSDMKREDSINDVWTLTATSNKRFTVSMIQSIGALELYHVTIRNFYGPDKFGDSGYTGIGAIGIAPHNLFGSGSNLTYRYTKIKNSVIEKCKARTGAAISVGNSDYLNQSLDPNDNDRYITLENVTIRDCVTFCDKDGWGGMIRCRGGSVHSMRLINSTFEGNFSHGDGAGLWWNAGGHKNTICSIDGCTFRNNRAMRNAGAMRLETTFKFTGNKTRVYGNECLGKTRISTSENTYTYEYDENNKGNGGGIHIYGYASSAYQIGGTFEYHLPDCLEISDNYSYGYGGGIAFDFTMQTTLQTGTRIISYFDGVVLKNNTSQRGGGGIYFNNTTEAVKNYSFKVYLNSGSISGNKAPDGGGIFVKKIDIDSSDSGIVKIKENNAISGSGGGIFLEDGDISLKSVEISGNSSRHDNDNGIHGGGGLYVKGGSFTISSGILSGNVSDMFGGGVLVHNSSSSHKTISLSGGEISGNHASYGGGITAFGNITLTMNNISLSQNTALNGGGIFTHGLNGYKNTVNYVSGLINRNTALKNSALDTAYDKAYTDVSGMGGGIYVGEYANLNITNPSNFGIYGNTAENGADDLFCYNRNTSVTLPQVSMLKLEDYNEAQIHRLFWAEDYIIDDINYNKGTNSKGSAWNGNNQRYRDVIENRVTGTTHTLNFGGNSSWTFTDKYLSLTLGWTIGKISIVKTGMALNENAIFKVFIQKEGIETEYMTVILTERDRKSDGSMIKEIAIENGVMVRIVETDWSWAYDSDKDQILRLITSESSDAERVFNFSNSQKTDAVIHSEAIKINIM